MVNSHQIKTSCAKLGVRSPSYRGRPEPALAKSKGWGCPLAPTLTCCHCAATKPVLYCSPVVLETVPSETPRNMGLGDRQRQLTQERRSSMAYTDRTLTCQDCSKSFVFSAEDQAFHAEKGYQNDPKRCPDCRQSRRSTSGDSRTGGGTGSRNREMFPATCAQCGKQTQVPFQPTGSRPVYCSDCFSKQRATTGRW